MMTYTVAAAILEGGVAPAQNPEISAQQYRMDSSCSDVVEAQWEMLAEVACAAS